MKYLRGFDEINEGKNIGILYHFTTLSDTISIINMDRFYSTQKAWKSSGDKYSGQISFTRDKFLFKNKPRGVSFGVRIAFDGNKLSNDFKISPVKFSTLWSESEEAVFTIGNWNDREKLKKHQIYNLSRYILSIDFITKDIYSQKIEEYEEDEFELVGIDLNDLFNSEYLTVNGKPKRKLIEKVRDWVESKGYKTRIIGDTFNKKRYIEDKNFLK